MKAWRVSRHGGREALEWIDAPLPEPGPMEVRVRVEATGLNHLDLWVRKGVEGHRFPLPLIPGCDVAGRIDAFGPGAEAALARAAPAFAWAGASDLFAAGAPVVLNPGVSCGLCEACLSGFDPICPRYGILGETRDGGSAEHVVVPAANLIPRPASLSATDAAALPIPFLTAWTMIHDKARLRPGETILVQAGGSGVSVAAIQMARQIGAFVVTTVGDDAKIERARALGADRVINYRKGPFREELKRILQERGKKGVDVAIDHVGADTFNESIRSLAWGGRLVTCGATSGSEVTIDLKAVFFKNLSLLGSTLGSKADLQRIVRLAGEGRLKPVVDSAFPLERYAEAQERLESRQAFGKVIVVTTG